MAPGETAPTLRAAADEAARAARLRWPGVTLDDAVFRAHVERHAGGAAPGALAGWHLVDLFLACACAAGDTVAVRAFDREILSRVPLFLSRLAPQEPLVDEVKQVLRDKLFVSDVGGVPKIDGYSGRGALEGWTRIAAVNTALKLLRRTGPEVRGTDEDAVKAAAPGGDPEIDYMKHRYRKEFEAAMRDAFAALEPKDRNVLRLHFLDGLNIDGIGAAYGAHRATAARWLARAKEMLTKTTLSLLRERLKLTPTELESLVALVQSRLEVSVRALVGG